MCTCPNSKTFGTNCDQPCEVPARRLKRCRQAAKPLASPMNAAEAASGCEMANFHRNTTPAHPHGYVGCMNKRNFLCTPRLSKAFEPLSLLSASRFGACWLVHVDCKGHGCASHQMCWEAICDMKARCNPITVHQSEEVANAVSDDLCTARLRAMRFEAHAQGAKVVDRVQAGNRRSAAIHLFHC